MNKTMITPVSQIQQLKPYAVEATRFEVKLKLDANEGPPLDWSSALHAKVASNVYPDRSAIESQLAKRLGVSSNEILVTAGGDEAIDRICRAYLAPGRNIIFPTPSFEMIRKYALMCGGEVRSVVWDSSFPVDKILEQCDEQTAIVSVVSPNNPTGKTVTLPDVERLATALPHCLLLIDQAYAEFEENASDESLTQFAINELSNAIVVRTFSKAWGMAGLRVGYALGSQIAIDNLRKVGGPFPVSSLSLAVVESMMQENPTGNKSYVDAVKSERKLLANHLKQLGCEVSDSFGNFVYAKLDSVRISSRVVFDALAAQGILVRQFPDENALRITCPGDVGALDIVTSTFSKILAPEAILFDMDGVLVDESPSYREAIRQTCETFGCDVSADEIAKKKLLGDANNDWIFSQRLLADHGLQVEFETVKERFEAIYQGDTEHPGLWDREVRLVDPQWLRNLAQHYPLAIVTGRPRHDAVRFLENEGLIDCFSAIVCLEDGPAKPRPDNVVNAMGQLNVNRAWMIGDTPDDVNAARKAGVIPFGIVAPTDDPEFATTKLKQAGAADVVANLVQLGDMLP